MPYLALAVCGSCRLSISFLCQSGSSPLVQAVPEAFQSKRLIWSISSMSLICYSALFLFHVYGHSATSFDRSSVMVGLGSLEGRSSSLLKKIVGLGILSGLSMLIRPTTIIVMIAFGLYSSSEEIGRPLERLLR